MAKKWHPLTFMQTNEDYLDLLRRFRDKGPFTFTCDSKQSALSIRNRIYGMFPRLRGALDYKGDDASFVEAKDIAIEIMMIIKSGVVIKVKDNVVSLEDDPIKHIVINE